MRHTDSTHAPQILICQNLRNNLQHPNEYLRGATLRFLCRIKEEEILEPLTPSILVRSSTCSMVTDLSGMSVLRIQVSAHCSIHPHARMTGWRLTTDMPRAPALVCAAQRGARHQSAAPLAVQCL